MKPLTNNSQILDWFDKTDFEGSILLYFRIDREKNTVLLTTSYPMGNSAKFHYKFRITLFEGVNNLERHMPVSERLRSFSENYESSTIAGTFELEDFKLQTYATKNRITLNFGTNFGLCEFDYSSIQTQMRKGKQIQRKQKNVIIDIDTNQEIDFNSPFKKG